MKATFARAVVPLVVVAVVALAGCFTLGNKFAHENVPKIEVGKTTIEQVQEMLGGPVRTGVEDGKLVWTYFQYRASIFGAFSGRDISVKFDDQNVVLSVNYNTTDPKEQLPLNR